MQYLDELEDEFEMFDSIGDGATSKVFKGKYQNKECAIKVVNNHRIYDEIEILKKLKHFNMIDFIAYFENSHSSYMLTEYFPGLDLYNWKQSNINENVDKIIIQLCDVVGYIHSHNYIHGDLSARNVLINTNKNIKLIDFGSAKKVGEKKIISAPLVYLSPEILKYNQETTKKSDLWALGILIFISLQGRLPFEGNIEKTVYTRIINMKINYKKFNIKKRYKKILKKLLKKNPEKRRIKCSLI